MKGLLLLSGGIDSPVAGYLRQQEGDKVLAVHFSQEPFTDDGPEIKSKASASLLGFENVLVVNLSKELEEISQKTERRYYFVLMKRLMYRKAQEIAKEYSCDYLITGESLGQVSSQTLKNMRAIDESVTIPVVRPLLAYDKKQIISLAQKIGTFKLSLGPEVCDVLGPKHPITKADLRTVHLEEAKLVQTSIA